MARARDLLGFLGQPGTAASPEVILRTQAELATVIGQLDNRLMVLGQTLATREQELAEKRAQIAADHDELVRLRTLVQDLMADKTALEVQLSLVRDRLTALEAENKELKEENKELKRDMASVMRRLDALEKK
jgi:chromosome segregation ATPase